MKKVTQERQVIEVRRIVQNSSETFKIQPGLWALEEMRDVVLRT